MKSSKKKCTSSLVCGSVNRINEQKNSEMGEYAESTKQNKKQRTVAPECLAGRGEEMEFTEEQRETIQQQPDVSTLELNQAKQESKLENEKARQKSLQLSKELKAAKQRVKVIEKEATQFKNKWDNAKQQNIDYFKVIANLESELRTLEDKI
jgi:flagellar motor protein MotB